MPQQLLFLKKIAQEIINNEVEMRHLAIVLPNKRGELYLKKYLSNTLDKPALAPHILTIEQYVSQVSGLDSSGGIELYFEAYKAYLTVEDKPESFKDFLKWIPSVLHDFNEIDRHMVNAADLFDNVLDAKTLENWGVDPDQPTELIQGYLTFWKNLKPLYFALSKAVLDQHKAWQGLSYLQVAKNKSLLEAYHLKHKIEHVVFAGFNALNAAEIEFVSDLLHHKKASIYWDTDAYYNQDVLQEAGMFIRGYKSTWPHYKQFPFLWEENLLNQEKNITIYGVNGPVGQAKKVGEILDQLDPKKASETAVVLADEQLLVPVLNGIPEKYDKINITMGVGIQQIPITHFTLQYLQVCTRLNKAGNTKIYFKDLKRLFAHKVMTVALEQDQVAKKMFFEYISQQNLAFISFKNVQEIETKLNLDLSVVRALFSCNQVEDALKNIEHYLLIYAQNETANKLEKEAVYQLTLVLHQLQKALQENNFANDFEVALELYRQLLTEIQLTFYGEPLSGLQVMGLLETRTLDFETVILTSINEGVLPSGKSQNSFIPFDLRRYFNLPVHTEKDAVYAYHFFRLLQRAKHVFLIYNTVAKGLGSGEKSRFINQIESEMKQAAIVHKTEDIVIEDTSLEEFKSIEKGAPFQEDLRQVLQRGLSPTSLASYVKNPMEFYIHKVLRVRDEDEVEEIVGYNTLGTVIHEVLERFYAPFLGGFPAVADFKKMHENLNFELTQSFETHFRKGNMEEGKNFLIYKVGYKMIERFLEWDAENGLRAEKSGRPIVILDLEKEVTRKVKIKDLDLEVNLLGTIDRLEKQGNDIRIIDYKTGAVLDKELSINDVPELFDSEKDKGKSLQLMMYAFMLNQEASNINAGIISLRNQSNGLMLSKVNIKPKVKEVLNYTPQILQEFEKGLVLIIREMFDNEMDIVDKTLFSLEE